VGAGRRRDTHHLADACRRQLLNHIWADTPVANSSPVVAPRFGVVCNNRVCLLQDLRHSSVAVRFLGQVESARLGPSGLDPAWTVDRNMTRHYDFISCATDVHSVERGRSIGPRTRLNPAVHRVRGRFHCSANTASVIIPIVPFGMDRDKEVRYSTGSTSICRMDNNNKRRTQMTCEGLLRLSCPSTSKTRRDEIIMTEGENDPAHVKNGWDTHHPYAAYEQHG
jgi:hypothetical protein